MSLTLVSNASLIKACSVLSLNVVRNALGTAGGCHHYSKETLDRALVVTMQAIEARLSNEYGLTSVRSCNARRIVHILLSAGATPPAQDTLDSSENIHVQSIIVALAAPAPVAPAPKAPKAPPAAAVPYRDKLRKVTKVVKYY